MVNGSPAEQLIAQAGPDERPSFQVFTSEGFDTLLDHSRVSLAISTYQIGSLFLVGLTEQNRISIYERTYKRAMGMCADGHDLWMATESLIWRFANGIFPGQPEQGFDANYTPRTGYTTGDIDVHDLALDAEGELVFIATLFNCLCRLDPTYSFKPIWRPPFISRIAPEDRCHLNGFCMKDGQPAFATACGTGDVADAWRETRNGGGVVIDIASNEIICEGLSMPHSPRWHDGKLWLLNSGAGELGYVDFDKCRFQPVAFAPGFGRGLTFFDHYAVVGLSKPRHNTFAGLPLDEALDDRELNPECGLHIIDLNTGQKAHWMRLEGIVQELYDVVALPNIRKPKAMGFMSDELSRDLRAEHDGKLTHWAKAAHQRPASRVPGYGERIADQPADASAPPPGMPASYDRPKRDSGPDRYAPLPPV